MEFYDIDIKHLAKITREEVKHKFANDPRLNQILSVFDAIDKYGNNPRTQKDGALEPQDIEGCSSKLVHYAALDANSDNKVNEYELSAFFNDYKGSDSLILSFDEAAEPGDLAKILRLMSDKGQIEYAKKMEEKERVYNEVAEKLDFPIEVVRKFDITEGSDLSCYSKISRDGKTLYQMKSGDYESGNYAVIRDENGKIIEIIESGPRDEDGNGWIGYGDPNKNKTYDQCITKYDSEGEAIGETYIDKTTGNIAKWHFDESTNTHYDEYLEDGIATQYSSKRNDDGSWTPDRFEGVVFNAGKADSTQISFKYGENNEFLGLDIKENTPEDDRPRGFITDGEVYLTHIPKKPTTVDTSTIEIIKQMMDGGARYGEDFDLKIEDGKLKVVPKIHTKKGETAPELQGEAFDKYKDLVAKGIHQGEDFEVTYDKNGNFRYNLMNNQAREFGASYKTEVYDKEGNFIYALSVVNGEIIKESVVDGKKQTNRMSFDEGFLQLLLEGDFESASELLGDKNVIEGGYNIYVPAMKYKELTGRELMADVFNAANSNVNCGNLLSKLYPPGAFIADTPEEAVKYFYEGYEECKPIIEFDPYKSQVAHMLPRIERNNISENEFNERVNENSFNVKISDTQITVSKNNAKALSIDISAFPVNYVNTTLKQVNAAVLYDIAATGTRLVLKDDINPDPIYGTINGYFAPADNCIYLDPNATIGDRAIMVITHESGHMCEFIDDKDNAIKAIKEQIKQKIIQKGNERPYTMEELLQKHSTFQAAASHDEKLKELFKKELANYEQNRPKININGEYALTDIKEFFAEAYCLLNTGTGKCAYIIANYFPETLARAKELMEECRAFKDTQH